ncbi:MAG: DUF4160 domain-containing protein [Leptospiraceae bacterium]|nr:DUF4160 domain-containing protein [Leptospiraceae bacterium]
MKEWIVNLNEIDFEDLYKSIKNGPMNEKGKHRLTEETIASIGALKIQIFSNEHPPPHFRVILNDLSNNFTIKNCEPLNGDSLKKYFRNIRKWHSENKETLIAKWNSSRPTHCPVGLYQED